MAGVRSGVELRLARLHLPLGEAVLRRRHRVQVHAVGVGTADPAQEEVAVLGRAEARTTPHCAGEDAPNLTAAHHAAVARHDAGERLLLGREGDVPDGKRRRQELRAATVQLLDELRAAVQDDLLDLAVLPKHGGGAERRLVRKRGSQTDDVHQAPLDDANALQVVEIAVLRGLLLGKAVVSTPLLFRAARRCVVVPPCIRCSITTGNIGEGANSKWSTWDE